MVRSRHIQSRTTRADRGDQRFGHVVARCENDAIFLASSNRMHIRGGKQRFSPSTPAHSPRQHRATGVLSRRNRLKVLDPIVRGVRIEMIDRQFSRNVSLVRPHPNHAMRRAMQQLVVQGEKHVEVAARSSMLRRAPWAPYAFAAGCTRCENFSVLRFDPKQSLRNGLLKIAERCWTTGRMSRLHNVVLQPKLAEVK